MTRGEVVTVDGVTYASKRAASWALHELGWGVTTIAAGIGSTVAAVDVAIRAERRKRGLPPRAKHGAQMVRPALVSADSAWSESKIDKAVQLYSACLDLVAEKLAVPRGELEKLWIRGQRPPMPPLEIGDCVDVEPEDEPSRDDDEAELARLAALEGDDESEEVADPEPAAPFPAPGPVAPAAQASPPVAAAGQFRLIDETGRFLHESLDGMTTNPRFAWKGDAGKLKAVRQRLPHTRQLDAVSA